MITTANHIVSLLVRPSDGGDGSGSSAAGTMIRLLQPFQVGHLVRLGDHFEKSEVVALRTGDGSGTTELPRSS